MLGDYLRLVDCGHIVRVSGLREEHSHPLDQLLLWVLSGRGTMTIDGAEVPARPGHLFFAVAGHARAFVAHRTDPWEVLWVRFSGRLAPQFAREIRAYGAPVADLGLDAEVRDRWLDLVIAHAGAG
ncbi:AraC family ligand binding domain-containing protein, partial [bacterium]|nr:AraC family ligand binding domain-containing protein [bacterium]